MFDNVHEEVADLRSRVEKLEALFSAGKADAQANMQPAQDMPVQPTEATDGEVPADHPQDGNVPGQE